MLIMTWCAGMHDNLTHYLVDRTRSSAPYVIKYVPYGSLSEVCSFREVYHVDS